MGLVILNTVNLDGNRQIISNATMYYIIFHVDDALHS